MDDFPYYSKRIRAALRYDIACLYQKNIQCFCVSENNDSDITFMSLVAEMRDDIKTVSYTHLDVYKRQTPYIP